MGPIIIYSNHTIKERAKILIMWKMNDEWWIESKYWALLNNWPNILFWPSICLKIFERHKYSLHGLFLWDVFLLLFYWHPLRQIAALNDYSPFNLSCKLHASKQYRVWDCLHFQIAVLKWILYFFTTNDYSITQIWSGFDNQTGIEQSM